MVSLDLDNVVASTIRGDDTVVHIAGFLDGLGFNGFQDRRGLLLASASQVFQQLSDLYGSNGTSESAFGVVRLQVGLEVVQG